MVGSAWRGQAGRSISGITKHCGGAGRGREDRAEARRLRLRGALSSCMERGDNIVTAHEGAIGEVDGGAVIEIDCHLGELVLLGCRASDVGIN